MSLLNIDRARSLKDRINETADPTVGALVAKYGTNVERLKIDTAAGKVNPTNAVMAMMMIQRIVAAQTQPPSGSTVAQDVGLMPPPKPMGLSAMAPQAAMPPQAAIPPQAAPAAPQQPPVRMAYGGQVAVSNNQVPSPAMERGLSGLPVPDNMFDYADGGMIAFAGGGDVQRFQLGGRSYVGKSSQELRMLLQAAQSMPDGPEKVAVIQAIQAELPNAEGLELARTRGGVGAPPMAAAPEPAAAPTATPPAAKEGVTLQSVFRQLSQPIDIPKPDYAALRTQAKEMYPDVNIEAPDRDKIATEQLEAAKKFGYDPNLTATQKAEYETEREGLKTQRKEAADMAILKAGLNILGGTSPYAFVNIGKGGSEAAQEFGKDIREIQKLSMQLKKEQQALERAANQDALQRSDKTEAAYRDALARKEAAEQKVLDRRASTFNSLVNGEYGSLREKAQQAGQNLRQIASSLTSTEVAGINAAASAEGYGPTGGKVSDAKAYARAKNLRDSLKARLDGMAPDDPNRAAVMEKFQDAQREYDSMREAVELTRGIEQKKQAAAAATSRANVDVSEEKRKIQNFITLRDPKYKKLKDSDPQKAAQYLEDKTNEEVSKIINSANRPAAPAASSANPLELNLPGR